MKTKVTIIAAILLIFMYIAGNTSVMAEDANKTAEAAADSTKLTEQQATQPKLIAYYFHGTRRCVSCKKIEAYTREAIETGFAEQIKSGEVQWLTINTDEEANEHYRDDYKLYTKSVILSERKDGKEANWKNLQKVWELIKDKEAFIKYVQDEVNAVLKED